MSTFLRSIIAIDIYPTLSYTLLSITDIVFVSLKSQIFCNYAFRCKSKSHLICKCRQTPVVRPVCPCNLTKKNQWGQRVILEKSIFLFILWNWRVKIDHYLYFLWYLLVEPFKFHVIYFKTKMLVPNQNCLESLKMPYFKISEIQADSRLSNNKSVRLLIFKYFFPVL